MKILALVLLTFFCVTSAQANIEENIGFKNGNNIQVVKLKGYLTAMCPINESSAPNSYYTCTSYTSEPTSHDYFIHPALDADSVQLTSVHEDGSTRTKKLGFNGAKGVSTKKVNISVTTLLQKPLLDFGTNTVTYNLMKNKQVVKSGVFTATRTIADTRQCKPGVLYFDSIYDCRDENMACAQYFAQQNNCQ